MKRLLALTISMLLLAFMAGGLYAQEEDDNGKGEAEGESFVNKIKEKLTVGATGGLAEPWSYTGDNYSTGFQVFGLAQYDLTDIVSNLSVELSFGYESFSSADWAEVAGSASVIPIAVNGVYAIKDFAISETATVSAYGFGGLGINLHSWSADDAGTEIDGQTAIGVNFGVGAAYPINDKLKVNLRLGYYLSMTSEIAGTVGGTAFTGTNSGHGSTPVMVGVTFKL